MSLVRLAHVDPITGKRSACLHAPTDLQIDVLKDFRPVDKGFNLLVKDKEKQMLSSNLTLAVVLTGFMAALFLVFKEYRRDFRNNIILVDANQQLEGLLWILTCQLYPDRDSVVAKHAASPETKAERRHNMFSIELGRLSAVSKDLVLNQNALRQKYLEQNNDARSLANNGSDYDSVRDDSAMDSDERDEVEFQKEVDRIIKNVVSIDLGDDVSNKEMHDKLSRYQEDNKYLTAQLSQRSKRSNRSNFTYKSGKSRASRLARVPDNRNRPLRQSIKEKSDDDIEDKSGYGA